MLSARTITGSPHSAAILQKMYHYEISTMRAPIKPPQQPGRPNTNGTGSEASQALRREYLGRATPFYFLFSLQSYAEKPLAR